MLPATSLCHPPLTIFERLTRVRSEAGTNCGPAHNQGIIPSTGAKNAAFWSRSPPITEPLPQNSPSTDAPYDKTKTYLSLVIGDGDNFPIIERNYLWNKMRSNACNSKPKLCYPLAWTVAPALTYMAPDIIKWFYEQGAQRRTDHYILGASGDSYSYPAMMTGEMQAEYAKRVNEDGRLLGTDAANEWEFVVNAGLIGLLENRSLFLSQFDATLSKVDLWRMAEQDYYPRYSQLASTVKTFFTVNAPAFLPQTTFHPDEQYKVLDGDVVVFKNNEWRGRSLEQAIKIQNLPAGKGETFDIMLDEETLLTPEQQAARINELPLGTVSYLYLTSDGSTDELPMNISALNELVEQLEDHVQVVDPVTVRRMALAAGPSRQTSEMDNLLAWIQKTLFPQLSSPVDFSDSGKQDLGKIFDRSTWVLPWFLEGNIEPRKFGNLQTTLIKSHKLGSTDFTTPSAYTRKLSTTLDLVVGSDDYSFDAQIELHGKFGLVDIHPTASFHAKLSLEVSVSVGLTAILDMTTADNPCLSLTIDKLDASVSSLAINHVDDIDVGVGKHTPQAVHNALNGAIGGITNAAKDKISGQAKDGINGHLRDIKSKIEDHDIVKMMAKGVCLKNFPDVMKALK